MKVLIGTDIGSTNVKTVIFDENCRILASETKEIDCFIPKPGWTEYDCDQFWDAMIDTVQRSIKKANIDPCDIAGIGVSGQGCVVPMDKEGKVLFHGMNWADQRTQDEVKFLIDNCLDDIYSTSMNYPSTMYSAPKLMWLKRNKPEVYKKIYKFTESYGLLVQRLTGEFTIDYSFASGWTLGFDPDALEWDKTLIEKMGLDIDIFPRAHDNMEEAGRVTEKAAKEAGLVPGIPVYVGGPDYTAAAIASGALCPGQVFLSCGSGGDVITITDNMELGHPGLISNFHAKGHPIRQLNGLLGSVGFSMKWFRNEFGGLEQIEAEKRGVSAFDIMSEEAGTAEAGSGGVLFIPYLYGKFCPELNPFGKGVYFGMNGLTTRAQMIRAIMEGTCFDIYEVIRLKLDLGVTIDEVIFVGGPSKSDVWCQILADVTNRKILTVSAPEASPFGDAVLAGVGTGIFASFEEVAEKYITREKEYFPNPENHALYDKLFDIYQKIYSSTKTLFTELDELIG